MSDISNNQQPPEGEENNEINQPVSNDQANDEEVTARLQNVFASISETAASVVNSANNSNSQQGNVLSPTNSLENTIYPTPQNNSYPKTVNTNEYSEQYAPPPPTPVKKRTPDDFPGDDSTITGTISTILPPTKPNSIFGEDISWFDTREYIIFSNQLNALKKNNVFVLKECKENKRLLDLKYADLMDNVNNIQTSVIFVSTISGFIQATREQFELNSIIVSVIGITISTYISLILSISKYYKLDELKEQIQNLRSKYSVLHNKIEYRMDVLGPWNSKKLWIHVDPAKKLEEWKKINEYMETDYNELIQTKQELCSEFEIIMDTKSRNKYFIKNKELNYNNRTKIYKWSKKELELEEKMTFKDIKPVRRSSLVLQHEEIDNWGDDDSEV